MACDGICRSMALMCGLTSSGFTIKDNVKTSADSEFACIIMHHHASFMKSIHLSSFPWWWKQRQGCSDGKEHVCDRCTLGMEETRSEYRTTTPKSSHNCRAVLCPRLASLPLDQPDSHCQQLPRRHSISIRQDSVSVPRVAYFDFGLKWVCLKIGYPKTSYHKFCFYRISHFLGYPQFWYKPPNLTAVNIPIILSNSK